MNYKQAVEYVENLGLFSKPPSTDRIARAARELNAENKFRVIHIAGTNGKGSVSAFASAALKGAKIKTGLFISPHIFDIRERISINGRKISEADFARLAEFISQKNLSLTMFEFLTLMAFLYFNENKVEVAVLETGLGGRLDATNISQNKIITAITKIGLDHEKILGGSIEEVAAEKCGIINTEKTVCSPVMPKAALSVIRDRAKELIVPDISALADIKISPLGNTFIYKSENYETRMGGDYQIENAITAIEILKNSGLDISEQAIKQGLKTAFMPARMQQITENPPVIVDGAHNPDGGAALKCELEKSAGFTAVIGFMRDKDYKKVLATTLPYAGNVICVAASKSARALPPRELCESAKEFSKNCLFFEDVKAALEYAINLGKPVFVYGSLYLAATVLEIFKSDN